MESTISKIYDEKLRSFMTTSSKIGKAALLTLGTISALDSSYRLFDYCYRHLVRSRHVDIYRKYGGKDSYAVITGGSDGIGLAFAKKMAEQGFNICIVGRNESKINEKLQEIVETSSPTGRKVKTRCVVADFSEMHLISEYQEKIADKLSDIDIAMLFLNAGCSSGAEIPGIKGTPAEEIQRVVTVNVLHPTYLCKVLLERLATRAERSAIVITSSLAAFMTLPGGLSIYGATKAFVTYMAEGLSFEEENTIDVISYNPGGVLTNMLKKSAPPEGLKSRFTVTPEQSTAALLRDLGRDRVSIGCARHELMGTILSKLPTFVIWSLLLKPKMNRRQSAAEAGGELPASDTSPATGSTQDQDTDKTD